MKKNYVFYSCSTIALVFFIFGSLLFRDIYRTVNYFKNGEKAKDALTSKIGLNGIVEQKKISLSEVEKVAITEFDKIALFGNRYVEYKYFNGSGSYILLTEKLDENKINEISMMVKKFNNGMNWKLIKNLEWDVFADFPSRKHPFEYSEVYNACRFLFLFENYCRNSMKKEKTSIFWVSALKFEALLQLAFASPSHDEARLLNDYSYMFYDRLMKNEYSPKEMEYALKNVIELQKLRDNYINDCVKYDHAFSKRVINFAYKEIPFLTRLLSFILAGGDFYKSLDYYYKDFMEGNYADGEKKLSGNGEYIAPFLVDFTSMYIKTIETDSFLSLIRANLEFKLSKPITAKDPFDGKEIRSIKKEDGTIVFYCLGAIDGKDEKGKGNNIINCDNEMIKKEKKKQKLRD